MRKGLMYSAEDPRSGEKYPDTFLTSYAALDIAESILKQTPKEIHDDTIKQMKEAFVQKPAITADQKMIYIRMTDMLNIFLKAFRTNEMSIMRLISSQCYIKSDPPTIEDFTHLLQSLFSAIEESECAELYKLITHNKSHVQNAQEITISDFVDIFHSKSLMSFGQTELKKEFLVDSTSEEIVKARKEWDELYPELDKLITKAKERINEQDIAHVIQCLNVEMDSAKACLICCDAHGLMVHIFSCVAWAQQLKWVLDPPNINEMHQTIFNFKNIV